MKKCFLFICSFVGVLCSSCERDVIFTFKERSLTNDDFELCTIQQCPTVEVDYLHITQPEVLIDPINAFINESVSATLNGVDDEPLPLHKAVNRYMNNSFNAYPETTEFSNAHEFTAQFSVSYSSNDVVCISYYGYVFDGGAHGFSDELYRNFNPRTGIVIAFEELVNEDFYAFAKAQFQQKYPNAQLDLDRKTFINQNMHQIGFSEEGMIVVYLDVYAIPIVEDGYHITIPWSEAEDFLTF